MEHVTPEGRNSQRTSAAAGASQRGALARSSQAVGQGRSARSLAVVTPTATGASTSSGVVSRNSSRAIEQVRFGGPPVAALAAPFPRTHTASAHPFRATRTCAHQLHIRTSHRRLGPSAGSPATPPLPSIPAGQRASGIHPRRRPSHHTYWRWRRGPRCVSPGQARPGRPAPHAAARGCRARPGQPARGPHRTTGNLPFCFAFALLLLLCCLLLLCFAALDGISEASGQGRRGHQLLTT